MDFSDLEHFALQILGVKDEETGELKPSEAALSYQRQFKEIYVDEYQDTNMVKKRSYNSSKACGREWESVYGG